MAATHTRSFNLTGAERAARLRARASNWNFFQLLGVSPQLGVSSLKRMTILAQRARSSSVTNYGKRDSVERPM